MTVIDRSGYNHKPMAEQPTSFTPSPGDVMASLARHADSHAESRDIAMDAIVTIQHLERQVKSLTAGATGTTRTQRQKGH